MRLCSESPMPGTNLHFRKQNTIEDVSTVPPTPRTPVTQIAADYPLDPCRFELSLGDRNLVEHGKIFHKPGRGGNSEQLCESKFP